MHNSRLWGNDPSIDFGHPVENIMEKETNQSPDNRITEIIKFA